MGRGSHSTLTVPRLLLVGVSARGGEREDLGSLMTWGVGHGPPSGECETLQKRVSVLRGLHWVGKACVRPVRAVCPSSKACGLSVEGAGEHCWSGPSRGVSSAPHMCYLGAPVGKILWTGSWGHNS